MAEKQRILIVDDDENIAELISLYLMKECYETKIVGDGESALSDFDEFKPSEKRRTARRLLFTTLSRRKSRRTSRPE